MKIPATPFDLPHRIDHTLLRPDSTKHDILSLCREANELGFQVVFVPPCYLSDAVTVLAGTGIRIGVPIGFPLGAETTSVKVKAAVEAFEQGAQELDMVLNVGRLKSGDYSLVLQDILSVVQATPGASHKVILETCYLSQEEKRVACSLAMDGGAQYVKTSTGFAFAGATVEDVHLMKQVVGEQVKIKASGGIRDLKMTCALLAAGADRIGTSAGVAIMKEWNLEMGKG